MKHKEKKAGYLSKKRSKGKIYLYLRKTYREEGIVKHVNLYGFGPLPKALDYMYWLRDNPEKFPDTLTFHGFQVSDLYEWILTLETKVTSTGREFNW